MALTDIDVLLAKYIAGDADENESAVAESWIAADEANRQYADSLQQIWDESRKLAHTSSVDEKAAWENFRKRISAATNSPAQALAPLRTMRWMQVAAAILILVAVTGIVIYKERPQKNIVQSEAAITKINSGNTIQKDTLPDGTIILLSPHSTLSCAAGFNSNQRNASLSGTAFFMVAHDSSKPFRITVNDLTVTVRGTSFSISETSGKIKVAVSTGVVEVSGRNQRMKLYAHDSLIVSEDKAWIKNTDTTGPAKIKAPASAKQQPRVTKTTMDGDDYLKQLATMKAILQELVENNVVKDISSIDWAGLSDTALIVNGNKQPAALQKALSKKYLRTAGEGYYYGPVKMNGKGYFFDRGEMNLIQ